MIKASELRIGNYISHPRKRVDIITEIGHKEVSFDKESYYARFEYTHEGYFLDYIKPIPLTEEWLLKFGAEKISNEIFDFYGYIYGYFLFENNELRITFQSQDMSNKIKYVHQLQNLYIIFVN